RNGANRVTVERLESTTRPEDIPLGTAERGAGVGCISGSDAQRSDKHPCNVWKSPANAGPPVQVGVDTPVTVTAAPGPAIPIDSPGRTPVSVACAPGPTAIAAGPDKNA